MVEKRIARFDNAKLILIFLVVAGHIVNEFRLDDPVLYHVYNFIYAFHIPAFVFISGYFSKPHTDFRQIVRLAVQLLVPYLGFHLLYHAFYHYTAGVPFTPLRIIDPHWTLWFLLSLFFWRVMLRATLKLPQPLLWVTGAGLLVGVIDPVGCDLSLCRTFVFFPFFILGHLCARPSLQKHRRWLEKRGPRMAAGGALIGVMAVIPLFSQTGLEDFFLGSVSYTDIGVSRLSGVALRAGTYLMSLTATAGFLTLMPRRRLFFTALGSRTLYVFLLHGFLVQLLLDAPAIHTLIAMKQYWLFGALPLLLTVILSSTPIIELTRPLVELDIPRFGLLARQLLGSDSRQRLEGDAR